MQSRRFFKKKAFKPMATKKVDQSQNKEIKKIQKTLKAIEPEVKCRHNIIGQQNFDQAAPKIFTLNGLIKGTNIDNRLGNVVRGRKLEIRLQVFANATMPYDTYARVLVVKEKTTLGSQVSLSQLLGSATPFSFSVRNYQTRDPDRYQIIKDVTKHVGVVSHLAAAATVPLANAPHNQDFMFTINLNTVVNHARGNAGTEADIDTNGYFLVVITDQPTVNSLALRGEFNYHYTDA